MTERQKNISSEHKPFVPQKGLVSVIVPIYNMETFVSDTLHSILSSSYSPLEIIAIDDGSTDNSLSLLQSIAQEDSRVRVLSQENAGVCRARNRAIAEAKGEFILPVDADNILMPGFIAEAVGILADAEVRAVAPRAMFFGEREGEWKLPPFDLHLLARKNILDTCALYRRADWERVGGYCEEIVAREDWEFWIHVLKDGGKVVRTEEFGLKYRIRKTSKRTNDRQLKSHVVRVLNQRHPEFFERELGGPLRQHRSWSRLINWLHRLFCPRRLHLAQGCEKMKYHVLALPQFFASDKGDVLYKRRNEIRRMCLCGEDCVVKSFQVPNLINRIAYGLLRKSKAQRSFEYAQRIASLGIGSPEPLAWLTIRKGFLFSKSFYVSRTSECQLTYSDLIGGKFPEQEKYLEAIAHTAARLHEAGIIHRDFSRGNILLRQDAKGRVVVELIDLNRLRFHPVSLEEGCRNFERLPMTPEMLSITARAYAEARGAEADKCVELFKNSPRETH